MTPILGAWFCSAMSIAIGREVLFYDAAPPAGFTDRCDLGALMSSPPNSSETRKRAATEEAQIVRRIGAGDQSALGELYDR